MGLEMCIRDRKTRGVSKGGETRGVSKSRETRGMSKDGDNHEIKQPINGAHALMQTTIE